MLTLCYKTEIRDTHDGNASYGAAFVQMNNGAWALIGHTNNYRTYPRAVRARTAAAELCRKHAKGQWPSAACDMEIIEMKQTAFIVEWSAREFARRVTADGRAWPSEARIVRQRREGSNYEWLHDCDFPPIDYVDGEDQETGSITPGERDGNEK